MGLVVNTNIGSLNAQRSLAINNASFKKSLERLSSGLRINRAGAISASEFTISKRSRGVIRGSRFSGLWDPMGSKRGPEFVL